MEQLYGQILADVIVYILGGGGYGWFQKKNIFCRLISRGKHYCKEIAGEKELLQWKNLKLGKNLVCKGKKILSPEVLEQKNCYPNQITHTPLPTSTQMIGPYTMENVTVYVYKLGSKLERAG